MRFEYKDEYDPDVCFDVTDVQVHREENDGLVAAVARVEAREEQVRAQLSENVVVLAVAVRKREDAMVVVQEQRLVASALEEEVEALKALVRQQQYNGARWEKNDKPLLQQSLQRSQEEVSALRQDVLKMEHREDTLSKECQRLTAAVEQVDLQRDDVQVVLDEQTVLLQTNGQR